MFAGRDPVAVESWTESEAAGLREFLKSDVGRRLGVMLRVLIESERSGAMRQDSSGRLAWRCGYAAGFEGCMMALDQLARWHESQAPAPRGVDERPDDTLDWLHGISSTSRPGSAGPLAGSTAGIPDGTTRD